MLTLTSLPDKQLTDNPEAFSVLLMAQKNAHSVWPGQPESWPLLQVKRSKHKSEIYELDDGVNSEFQLSFICIRRTFIREN